MFYEKKSLSIINLIPLYRILYLPDFANNFADFPFFYLNSMDFDIFGITNKFLV